MALAAIAASNFVAPYQCDRARGCDRAHADGDERRQPSPRPTARRRTCQNCEHPSGDEQRSPENPRLGLAKTTRQHSDHSERGRHHHQARRDPGQDRSEPPEVLVDRHGSMIEGCVGRRQGHWSRTATPHRRARLVPLKRRRASRSAPRSTADPGRVVEATRHRPSSRRRPGRTAGCSSCGSHR